MSAREKNCQKRENKQAKERIMTYQLKQSKNKYESNFQLQAENKVSEASLAHKYLLDYWLKTHHNFILDNTKLKAKILKSLPSRKEELMYQERIKLQKTCCIKSLRLYFHLL